MHFRARRNNKDKIAYDLQSGKLVSPIWYRDASAPCLQEIRDNIPQKLYKNKTETQIVKNIASYVNGLCRHDGQSKIKLEDPSDILKVVQSGKGVRCVEYSIIVAAFLNALGFCARVVGLKTKDVETRASSAGHVVAEVYLKNKKGWAMIDAQCNVVPTQKGKPLSIYEFQQLVIGKSAGLNVGEKYITWIKPYLYYLDTCIDQRYGYYYSLGCRKRAGGLKKRIMLVPLGAKRPKIFQIKYPMKSWGIVYTNSLGDFYQKPVTKNK